MRERGLGWQRQKPPTLVASTPLKDCHHCPSWSPNLQDRQLDHSHDMHIHVSLGTLHAPTLRANSTSKLLHYIPANSFRLNLNPLQPFCKAWSMNRLTRQATTGHNTYAQDFSSDTIHQEILTRLLILKTNKSPISKTLPKCNLSSCKIWWTDWLRDWREWIMDEDWMTD